MKVIYKISAQYVKSAENGRTETRTDITIPKYVSSEDRRIKSVFEIPPIYLHSLSAISYLFHDN